MSLFEGKIAVITGGASGIGLATVEKFLANGAKGIVVGDIQDAKGEKMARDSGGKIFYRHTDVVQESDVKALIDLATDKFGRIDCMFSNAGTVGPVASITQVKAEDFDRTMNVNVRAQFFGIKHVAPIMMKQKSGSIVNNSSSSAFRSRAGADIYSTSKAASLMLSKSAAVEMGPYNVRVNAVCPGAVATPLGGATIGLSREEADSMLKRVESYLADRSPIPRAGMPEDIANCVLWLASDLSTFVTGQSFIIDGGQTLNARWPADGNLFSFQEEMYGIKKKN